LRKINPRVRHLLPYCFYRECTLVLVEVQGEGFEFTLHFRGRRHRSPRTWRKWLRMILPADEERIFMPEEI